MGSENGVAVGIVFDLLLVHRPIDLDNQASGMAVEVHNEAINNLLTAKVETGQAVTPQG